MKVLLDENFPLGLVRVLEGDGLSVEHIITLGWRGASDARIRERLNDNDHILLQDEAVVDFGDVNGVILIDFTCLFVECGLPSSRKLPDGTNTRTSIDCDSSLTTSPWRITSTSSSMARVTRSRERGIRHGAG